MKLYNIEEIASALKISVKSARNKISKAGLKKTKTENGRALYQKLDLQYFEDEIVRYFAVRTIETYYIYESKMNN
jgi:predicted transcriptional regulator